MHVTRGFATQYTIGHVWLLLVTLQAKKPTLRFVNEVTATQEHFALSETAY